MLDVVGDWRQAVGGGGEGNGDRQWGEGGGDRQWGTWLETGWRQAVGDPYKHNNIIYVN